MRIAFVDAARSCWGAEESLVTLAAQLRRLGHEPVLVCFGAELQELWRERVGTPSVDVRKGRKDARPGSLRDLAVFAGSRVALGRVDAFVLFSHFLVPAIPLIRLRRAIAGRPRATLGIDLHDHLTGPRGRLSLLIGSQAADRVLAITAFTAAQIPWATDKTVVLHRPVRAAVGDLPAPREAPTDLLRIGIVGRLDPEKQHELLGDAIRLAGHPHRMVVTGSESPYAAGYAEELGARLRGLLGDRVEFRGRTPAEEALSGIDVLVVCNDREPMGRTVLEAQLAGIPVIVPDRGGAAELVTDGNTGLRFAARSAASLTAAIDRLWSGPALYSSLSREGLEQARRVADPEHYATEYLRALVR